MFEIKTEGSYPENYNAMVQQAKEEIANKTIRKIEVEENK